ncbi:MAG: glycosyl hydrolase [Chitinophagaceae bacterium]
MKKYLLISLLVVAGMDVQAQRYWPAITQDAKPWTRWWWMGSAVDEHNIDILLKQYSAAGLGGVEIVPIYGAKGYENKYIDYLSPKWMQMLDYSVKKTEALGMGIYVSVGTGWPIGGKDVTVRDAASKLIVQQYTLKRNTPFTEKITVNDSKQKGYAILNALMAFDKKGNAIDLGRKLNADGILDYEPKEDLTLYAVFNGKTRQMVKRAAPGGQGYTIDHFSSTATSNYFKIFDTAFGNTAHGVKAFFNDSYEVYNADWTGSFLDAFQKRRGYDLRKYLPLFVSEKESDSLARLKSDYRQTLSELMLQNFSTTFTQWAHKRNTLSVNQAHGSPGNLLDLYAAFDIPETETFGSSYFPIRGLRRDSADVQKVDPDPNMLKFASSAAHAYGKKMVSCETFTWLTEHFKTSWSQCKPEVDQVFLSGINHVFYHGTTYSPQGVAWPGWLFYASVNFVPTNSLWPHLKGLNDYIARCQAVLQSGVSDNELAIYWPICDIWNDAKGMDTPLSVHGIDEWLHPTSFYKNVQILQKSGYSLDFVSDKMLSESNAANGLVGIGTQGAKHKVLLVPTVDRLPLGTWKNLLRLANEGATIILQQLPQDVSGFNNMDKQKAELIASEAALSFSQNTTMKTATVGKGKIVLGSFQEALNYLNVYPESMAVDGLRFIRRRTDDAFYYFIVNFTEQDFDKTIALQNDAKSVLLMNPLDGTVSQLPFTTTNRKASFRLQLKSGQSMIVMLSDKKETATRYQFLSASAHVIDLTNNLWNIRFKEGGPILPKEKNIKGVQPWTAFTEDSTTQSFSGTGIYTTTFQLKKKDAKDYLLQFDKLYESAKVFVNGKDAGLLWSLPFELKIGSLLNNGQNTIRIEVCNLMANRIRDMDRNKQIWRNYNEINFVNANYETFDASDWKVQPSGIGGSVRIIPLK